MHLKPFVFHGQSLVSLVGELAESPWELMLLPGPQWICCFGGLECGFSKCRLLNHRFLLCFCYSFQWFQVFARFPPRFWMLRFLVLLKSRSSSSDPKQPHVSGSSFSTTRRPTPASCDCRRPFFGWFPMFVWNGGGARLKSTFEARAFTEGLWIVKVRNT